MGKLGGIGLRVGPKIAIIGRSDYNNNHSFLPMNSLYRFAACAVASIALLGQNNHATVQGTVRDSNGRPVAAVIVQLKTNDQTLTAKTDIEGTYRFSAAPGSNYTVRAETTGQGEATFGPFILAPKESKMIDLKLVPRGQPEFFDQPTFIVAGVADATNLGGHGSDVILRSSEDLTKAAASLSKEPPANSASEKSIGEAERHHALADADERLGNALDAVREYQRAAELDASERNLFDWGVELLSHRATEPAVEVFAKGNHLFPRSVRILLGLAVAFYSRGSYDQAAQRFFKATDLNPADPGPYLFLAKVQSSAITETDGFLERLGRFARLHPENPWANYYYAVSLWKRGNGAQVRSLLEKAIHIDPNLAAAHLQLGIVYAAQQDFPHAIAAYQEAIKIDPRMEEVHYRLAQAYVHTGESQKSQREFVLHDQLAQESAAEVERERREIRQFVIELRRNEPQHQ